MQNHTIGLCLGVRQGAVIVEHSYPLDFDLPTAVAKTLGTFQGSATKPTLVDSFGITQVAANGTTHSFAVTIGGAALQTIDAKGAANTKTAGTPKIITANSALVVTPTITGTSTVGRAWLCVQARELDVNETVK